MTHLIARSPQSKQCPHFSFAKKNNLYIVFKAHDNLNKEFGPNGTVLFLAMVCSITVAVTRRTHPVQAPLQTSPCHRQRPAVTYTHNPLQTKHPSRHFKTNRAECTRTRQWGQKAKATYYLKLEIICIFFQF